MPFTVLNCCVALGNNGAASFGLAEAARTCDVLSVTSSGRAFDVAIKEDGELADVDFLSRSIESELLVVTFGFDKVLGGPELGSFRRRQQLQWGP